MGAKITVENAASYYPWLGAKVVGSYLLPNYYTAFKDGAIVDPE